jgi:hypothetical protein
MDEWVVSCRRHDDGRRCETIDVDWVNQTLERASDAWIAAEIVADALDAWWPGRAADFDIEEICPKGPATWPAFEKLCRIWTTECNEGTPEAIEFARVFSHLAKSARDHNRSVAAGYARRLKARFPLGGHE